MSTDLRYGDIPEIPFLDFIFKDFDEKIANYKDRPWIVDIPSGRSVTFGQVKSNAMKIASALARKGFKQGDVFYFVTYEQAHLYLVHIGVWFLGGVMRGCFQGESPEIFANNMRESAAKFVLVDPDTVGSIRVALQSLDSKVEMISLGDEKLVGTTHLSELLKDDGSAFVKPKCLYPKRDNLVILNTSGSTGIPKGVVHTHFSGVAFVTLLESVKLESPMLEFATSYGVGSFGFCMNFLRRGFTFYHITKFDRAQFFNHLMAYRPRSVLMFPFVANWFVRCEKEVELLKSANFLKLIITGGWALDPATAELMAEKFPKTFFEQIYGMTEICFVACCSTSKVSTPVKMCLNEGQRYTSSGKLLPHVEAKVMDILSGNELGSYGVGELYIKSPCAGLGYIQPENQIDQSVIVDGWLRTGDLAFRDEEGFLYIKDRTKFIYAYKSVFVLPSEIEAVLLEHPDVQESGVAGVRDLVADNLSRAMVVLKPGRKCSEQDLCDFVANRLPEHKRLHGGVRFVDKLPENKGGKLDRNALLTMAQEINK